MIFRFVTSVMILGALLVETATADGPPLAFEGVTVETLGKAGRLETAIVLVEDGKISKVGKDVEIPENARIIDAAGMTLMPGIIDPYHVVSVSGSSSTRQTTITINGRRFIIPSRTSSSSSSFVKIADNFYPYDIELRTAIRNGLTTLNLVSSGYGESVAIRNRVEDRDDLILDGNRAAFASVTNDSTSLDIFRKGLAAANPKSDAKKSSATSKPSGSSSSSSSRSSTPSETTKLWKDVSDGKRSLIVNANNAASILHLLKATEDYSKIKLVLISRGPSLYQAREALSERKPSFILEPTIDELPTNRQRICTARFLHEKGMEFAFSLSVSGSIFRFSQDAPLSHVAFLVKAGLPRDAALAALTKVPAKMLGIEKTHGTIEAGKVANLLLFDGDPLDPASHLKSVFVEGTQVYEN